MFKNRIQIYLILATLFISGASCSKKPLINSPGTSLIPDRLANQEKIIPPQGSINSNVLPEASTNPTSINANFDIPEKKSSSNNNVSKTVTNTSSNSNNNSNKSPLNANIIVPTFNPTSNVNGSVPSGLLAYPLIGITKIFLSFGALTPYNNIANDGVDFEVPEGTNVYASDAGLVNAGGEFTQGSLYNPPGYTNTNGVNPNSFLRISHGKDIQTVYLPLSKTFVGVDDFVTKGQLIGLTGHYMLGADLHYRVLLKGGAVDPVPYLSGQ